MVAAATRPYPGQIANGDAWGVYPRDGLVRIIVADGLGHGPEAAKAATTAIAILRQLDEFSPTRALRACHAALAQTRGAAISIALVDTIGQKLTYAGVGNVEARLIQDGEEQRLIAYRGVVGLAMPTVRSFDFILASDWLLILHTDGVSSRFDLRSLPDIASAPQSLADFLLEHHGRPTDDATVLVVQTTRR